jgi:hypothetical protein
VTGENRRIIAKEIEMRQRMTAALALGILSLFASGSAAAQVSWQQSQAGVFQLGVRDKFATLGRYEAQFVVTDGQQQWRRTLRVSGDAWGYALFPVEFEGTGYAAPGKTYRWQARVGGQIAAQGSFVLP